MLNSRVVGQSQTIAALSKDVERRRRHQVTLRARIDAFVEKQRGVRNFSALVDEVFPPKKNELTLALARQLATANVENSAAELLAQWMTCAELPTQLETIVFSKDVWAPNSYKKSLTALPILDHLRSKLGSYPTRSQRVVSKRDRAHVNTGSVLGEIPAELRCSQWGLNFEGNLKELHLYLRRKAGLTSGDQYDFSLLWETCARTTSMPPQTAFVQNGHRSVRTHLWLQQDARYVRTGAEWYYLPYLSMFCSGERALLATTIEEDDENIRQYFLENMELLQREIGVEPLIIWEPHYSEHCTRMDGSPLNFTEFNPHLFQTRWQDAIQQPHAALSCYEAMNQLLHSLTLYSPDLARPEYVQSAFGPQHVL
ncbi:hypothetical protein COU77_00470 [Candidatus Peregrinibacteria bacterium CG10_big_fil_rev_8_21_14_0_10_49_16]|nr:MAG: hypothetical protein COU77_00470 [Candidatus Peregrinibacteria bacterium CG10_big_fil_rev_8_21_14_0_10_49_16]